MASGSTSAWSQQARSNRSQTPSARVRQSTNTPVSPTYSMDHQQFLADSYINPLVELRPGSTSHLTSSLSGAMGEPSAPSNSRHSRSPSMLSDASYPAGNGWVSISHTQSMMQQHSAYPGVPGMNNLGFGPQDSASNINYNFTAHRDSSPGSHSNSSGSSNYNTMFGSDQYSLQNSRHVGYVHDAQDPLLSSSGDEQLKIEVSRLRQQLRELRIRYATLEAAASPAFSDSWKKRTDARLKMFCSPNRAGNTLCAWHDSRRERREYPPRNAPPGVLNCGCTCEEALFEESLARRGVGSYHPGESVRMDPALRNPLLKLLQARYGYRDGDFERDPVTGEWIEGESDAVWQRKANINSTSRRQRVVDTDRR